MTLISNLWYLYFTVSTETLLFIYIVIKILSKQFNNINLKHKAQCFLDLQSINRTTEYTCSDMGTCIIMGFLYSEQGQLFRPLQRGSVSSSVSSSRCNSLIQTEPLRFYFMEEMFQFNLRSPIRHCCLPVQKNYF